MKGYYVRTPDCGGGNTLVDTSLMSIKPSMDEFNKISDAYLNTPYDPATGWNGEGHNQCDGKLGLPGCLSYYFSKDPAYVELDCCKYAFTVDDTCLNKIVQDDALMSEELGRTLGSNPHLADARELGTKYRVRQISKTGCTGLYPWQSVEVITPFRRVSNRCLITRSREIDSYS